MDTSTKTMLAIMQDAHRAPTVPTVEDADAAVERFITALAEASRKRGTEIAEADPDWPTCSKHDITHHKDRECGMCARNL